MPENSLLQYSAHCPSKYIHVNWHFCLSLMKLCTIYKHSEYYNLYLLLGTIKYSLLSIKYLFRIRWYINKFYTMTIDILHFNCSYSITITTSYTVGE